MAEEPLGGVVCLRGSFIFENGCPLQRLFSTFPDGWPGGGLLLLRLSVSLPLLNWAITDLTAAGTEPVAVALDFVAVAGAMLLIAGLWTPVAGTVVAIDQVWLALLQHPAPGAHPLIAALSASLAMLGPGAWSIDARLFGRKVVRSGDRIRGR